MRTKAQLVQATLLVVLATAIALAVVGCKRVDDPEWSAEKTKQRHVADNMAKAKLRCEEGGMVLAEYQVENNGHEYYRCEAPVAK